MRAVQEAADGGQTVNRAVACMDTGPREKEKGGREVTSVQKHLLSVYCLQNHGMVPERFPSQNHACKGRVMAPNHAGTTEVSTSSEALRDAGKVIKSS